MKRKLLLWICALASALLAQCLWAEPHLKSIKLAITNPTHKDRPAENIVLSVPELHKIAPDFYAGSQVASATDASTVADDCAVLHTSELPSQIAAGAGDFKPHE